MRAWRSHESCKFSREKNCVLILSCNRVCSPLLVSSFAFTVVLLQHKGNKRFRDVVALHRPDYVRAPKIQKPSVARVIVRAIRNGDPPGRFVRKDDKTGKWVDIGDKKAAEKTSQALREKTNEERDLLKAPPGLGVLLPNPASFLAAATASMVTGISAKKPEEAKKTIESKADDDNADEEAGDKEGEEKTGDKEKKNDDKEEEEAKEESKEEKESEAEPIVDGETALV
jgi:hypothetical protein